MKYDFDLVQKLYQKYMYRDKQGFKTDRNAITEEYSRITGVDINYASLGDYIKKFDKEKLFSERDVQREVIVEKTHVSERYIEIPTSQSWNEKDIIQAHGLDPEEWEVDKLGSTRSKIGSNKNDAGYLINTYQKASFKPKQFRLTQEVIENSLSKVFKDIKPIIVEPKAVDASDLLLIPFKDMHFGPNTYDDYKVHQGQVYRILRDRFFEKTIFIIGSDLFQTNDSLGRTVNDTQVDWNVNIEERLEWAYSFYEPLLVIAQEQSESVEVIFESGNHDHDQSLLFVWALKKLYPNIKFTLEEKKLYKLIRYHNCAIGTHHGDYKIKGKDVAEIFNNYFRKEMAEANYREVLIGHKHHDWSEEHLKINVKGLSTASKDTPFEYKYGFAGGDKSFQVRIYSRNRFRSKIIIADD